MKLLIALALAAAPSGLAMAPYVPITDEPTVSPIDPVPSPTVSPTKAPTGELNGCDKPCEGGVVTLDEISEFFDAEDNKCYVVKGTFPSSTLTVPDGVNCAKITVPSDSSLRGIIAHLPRPSYMPRAPRNVETRRRSRATTRRSSTTARSSSATRAPQLTERRSRTLAPLPRAAMSLSKRVSCVPPLRRSRQRLPRA